MTEDKLHHPAAEGALSVIDEHGGGHKGLDEAECGGIPHSLGDELADGSAALAPAFRREFREVGGDLE
jgi:hypothetical protein